MIWIRKEEQNEGKKRGKIGPKSGVKIGCFWGSGFGILKVRKRTKKGVKKGVKWTQNEVRDLPMKMIEKRRKKGYFWKNRAKSVIFGHF